LPNGDSARGATVQASIRPHHAQQKAFATTTTANTAVESSCVSCDIAPGAEEKSENHGKPGPSPNCAQAADGLSIRTSGTTAPGVNKNCFNNQYHFAYD
jgi:hypothetical protein